MYNSGSESEQALSDTRIVGFADINYRGRKNREIKNHVKLETTRNFHVLQNVSQNNFIRVY